MIYRRELHGGPDTTDFEIAIENAIVSGRVAEAWIERLSEEQITQVLNDFFETAVLDSLSDSEIVDLLGWYDY